MSPNIRTIEAKDVDAVIRAACILIVEDEFTTRKAVRTLLLAMGVTDAHDAGDGASGLAAVNALDPDVVILDWQLAGTSGPDFVRQVRSPDRFSRATVPIIMLTGPREPSHVIEAMRLGVHEFLVKPVSAKALYDRLASVLLTPRTMLRRGDGDAQTPRRAPSASQAGATHSGLPTSLKPGFDRSGRNMIVLD